MVKLLSGNSVGKFWKTYRGTSLFFLLREERRKILYHLNESSVSRLERGETPDNGTRNLIGRIRKIALHYTTVTPTGFSMLKRPMNNERPKPNLSRFITGYSTLLQLSSFLFIFTNIIPVYYKQTELL